MSEITLEVNPSKNLSLSQLDEFVDAGIDRFSIGVQVNNYSYLHYLFVYSRVWNKRVPP